MLVRAHIHTNKDSQKCTRSRACTLAYTQHTRMHARMHTHTFHQYTHTFGCARSHHPHMPPHPYAHTSTRTRMARWCAAAGALLWTFWHWSLTTISSASTVSTGRSCGPLPWTPQSQPCAGGPMVGGGGASHVRRVFDGACTRVHLPP